MDAAYYSYTLAYFFDDNAQDWMVPNFNNNKGNICVFENGIRVIDNLFFQIIRRVLEFVTITDKDFGSITRSL